MLARSILSEAARNLAANTSRAAVFAGIFVLVVCSIAVIDVRTVASVLREAEQYRSSGAAVQVVESTAGSVSGARCDALTGSGSIRGSGALRPADAIRALALPSSELTVWEVSPGITALLPQLGAVIGNPRAGGVWLSSDLAEALGARAGDSVVTDAGRVDVAAVYEWPDDGRARELAYAIVVPVGGGGIFDRCWAQIWPDDDDAAALILTSVAGTADVGLSRLNSAFGSSFDASTRIAERATVVAPAGGVAAGFLLAFVAVWIRRLELAAALHARVPRSAIAAQQVIEAAAWVVAASLVSISVVVFAAAIDNPDTGVATWQIGARTVAAAAASALLGALAAASLVREKQLFRYFKDR